jgi:hypothetical protein
MSQFSTSQRLRLRLLAKGDVKVMTEEFLNKHYNFRKEAYENREKFIHEIVSRAEGVFL